MCIYGIAIVYNYFTYHTYPIGFVSRVPSCFTNPMLDLHTPNVPYKPYVRFARAHCVYKPYVRFPHARYVLQTLC